MKTASFGGRNDEQRNSLKILKILAKIMGILFAISK
jgi:hypothetical protein